MRACEDFELEKVNKDNGKVDYKVDDDHDGNDNKTMMLMTITRQMMLFSFLTFSHLPRGTVPCQPYFLTLCPLLEIIWLEENGVKFVRFGRHTTFSLAPGK